MLYTFELIIIVSTVSTQEVFPLDLLQKNLKLPFKNFKTVSSVQYAYIVVFIVNLNPQLNFILLPKKI